MKPLYLLIIILTLGNCITTTSYNYPEGLPEKKISEADKKKLPKLKVNLFLDSKNWENEYSPFFFLGGTGFLDNFRKAFKHDSNSQFLFKVNLSNSPSSLWVQVFCGWFIPCVWSSSVSYSIQYGFDGKLMNKEFKIYKRKYLLIPWLSQLSFLSSQLRGPSDRRDDKVEYYEIEENFIYSLREEIAKIAPPELAVQEGDTPVTSDLPKTFTDIVVLKNGEILDGVHTKVTPTTLEVTESNGKKTIYKKSQVLSVKKR